MTQSLKTEPRIKKGKYLLHSLQSTHVWKWPVGKYKHIKIKPRICVLFILCLTWTMNANSLKQNTHTHTHTHPFNGPFSGTTQVSR